MNEILARRLQSYWRMEAANVILVPALVVFVVLETGGVVSIPLLAPLAGNMLLLAIGACYWRITLLKVQGDDGPFNRWLPLLGRLQLPAALGALASCAVALIDVAQGDGSWPPERIALACTSALCALEYVNYYHVQLQHFDHAPDFRRLLRTGRFRPAHLARDLAALRNRSTVRPN